MVTDYTENDLIQFEDEIATCFNSGMIKAPIHLYNGNEKQILEVFDHVNEDDWIFCTWRSHYQCLLKGVSPDVLKKDILDGKSISLCYPSHKIYSSGIVAGNIPIATGVALSIKLKNETSKVWCFVGDMGSETGTFFENWKYAVNKDLPITYVIEDNNRSVCTDTKKTWGSDLYFKNVRDKIMYYQYQPKYPHAGAGKRIQF